MQPDLRSHWKIAMLIGSGILAGLIATAALSALMVLVSSTNADMGVDVIQMISVLGERSLGLPRSPIVGWVGHFILGSVVWGSIFVVFERLFRGPYYTLKGIVFATFLWILMMTCLLPLAGAGFFGLSLGIQAPILALILHLVYGVVLGSAYGALVGPQHLDDRFNVD